jgi:hypothetical protein
MEISPTRGADKIDDGRQNDVQCGQVFSSAHQRRVMAAPQTGHIKEILGLLTV